LTIDGTKNGLNDFKPCFFMELTAVSFKVKPCFLVVV